MFWRVRSSSRREGRSGWLCLTTMPIDGLSMKVPMTTACLKDCRGEGKAPRAGGMVGE